MNRLTRALSGSVMLIVCVVFTGALSVPAARADQSEKSEVLEVLTAAQLLVAQQQFAQLLRNPDAAKEIKTFTSLGFDVVSESEVVVLDDQHKRGLGHYTIHRHHRNGLLLQAPHQFFDKHTGVIARRLFEENAFTAMSINSVSRKKTDRAQRILDLAHRDDTLYYAHTRAFLMEYPHATVLQLHGFAQDKRRTEQGRQAQIILSLAGAYPDATLKASAVCLRQQYQAVLTYPDQVAELGGTRNRIAQLVRQYPEARFVHIELAKAVRKQLKSSAQAREHFYQCLAKPPQ